MPRTRVLTFVTTFAMYLILGAAMAVAVGAVIAFTVDPFQAPPKVASAFDGRGTWNVTRWDRRGATAVNSVRRTVWAWSVRQVVGPPDTNSYGDIQSAWASAAQDDGVEWLELAYAQSVLPSYLLIHETFNPGAVTRVTVYNAAGEEVEAWRGTDPSPRDQNQHVSKIPLEVGFATNRVRIELDSGAVPGWNEIDAVALMDRDGNIQWAMDARASSAYSGGKLAAGTGGVDALIPTWSQLEKPMAELITGTADAEDRLVVAYGWPWRALVGEETTLPPSAKTGAANSPAPTNAGSLILSSGRTTVGGGGGPLQALFPRRFLWKGLAADALLFAALLFALRWAIVRPHRFLVESSRIRRGCCLACGYDLRYDFVPGCPECGWRRVTDAIPRVPS